MISLWQALKNRKMAKPNHFCWADIWTFWYFDVSAWSDEKNMVLSGLCQNSVTAPYCKDWEARYPQNTSERLPFPKLPLRYPQMPLTSPPRHPKEISWEHKTPIDNNRRQQTQRDSFRHPKTLTGAVWVCLAMSVGVCCLLLASCANWRYLGGCLGDVWWVSGGIWVVFMEIGGAWMCLGGIWLLSPCSMEP